MYVSNGEIQQVIESVWTTLLGFEAQPADGTTALPDDLTGCVHITGEWDGVVTLVCPRRMVQRASGVMFGIDAAAAPKDLLNDALGELINVLGGNLKALMPGPSRLSLPIVVDGSDYTMAIRNARVVNHVSFQCDDDCMTICVMEADSRPAEM
ncbi:MAG: chemotaxis protein CheX [Gemmataceae bacterium]|nr:chemotaxis protein CheX [Gemmataceae bacterium]